MRYSEGLDTTGVSDLAISVRSRGNKDQSGLSYHLHHSGETCAPASSEHAQSTTFGPLVEASLFKLTGWFHIHLFIYLSYSSLEICPLSAVRNFQLLVFFLQFLAF